MVTVKNLNGQILAIKMDDKLKEFLDDMDKKSINDFREKDRPQAYWDMNDTGHWHYGTEEDHKFHNSCGGIAVGFIDFIIVYMIIRFL